MTSAQRVLRITGAHQAISGHGPSERESSLAILVLLGGLDIGGAEYQAISLASALQQRGHTVSIVSLKDGPLRSVVEQFGLPLEVLRRPLPFSPTAVPALVRTLRRTSPDIVYAFLDVQWLMALAARSLAPGARVVLGLRSSQYFQHVDGARDRIVHQLTRRFSRFADLLIANSLAGLEDFNRCAAGAPTGLVVPNGIDQTRFCRDLDARVALRREWMVPPDGVVVGHVGRLDPVKDHETLIDAVAQTLRQDSRIRLVCAGDGTPERLAALRAHATSRGIDDRVRFIGRRSDLPAVYSAFDVLALPSVREGFPSVVAEAMLCGVPAVVTNTGASADIVGALGEVVPCGDVNAFAAGLERLIVRRSAALSARCRLHILADFTIDRCASLTSAALLTLIPSTRRRQ